MSRAVLAKILLGALLEVGLIGAATSCSSSQTQTPSDASTAGGSTEADGASKPDINAASPADGGIDGEGGSGGTRGDAVSGGEAGPLDGAPIAQDAGANPGVDASAGTDAAPDAQVFSGEAGTADAPASGSGGTPLVDIDIGPAISAILEFVNAHGTSTQATRRTEWLAFVQSRAEVLLSGINDDGVWAIFRNGAPLMILDNRDLDPPSSLVSTEVASLAVATVTEVPKGTSARIINTLGAGFIDETPPISQLLASKGYSVVRDPGTVESMRNISGDGVFYISSHGGICLVLDFDP